MTFFTFTRRRIIIAAQTIIIACIILIGWIILDDRMHPIYRWDAIQINNSELPVYPDADDSLAIITDIYFDDEQLIYDAVTNTFYYSAINDGSIFNPIISIPSNSLKNAIHYGKPNLKICLDDMSKIAITYNGKSSISNLVITSLPVMNITVSKETIDTLGLDETYAIEEYEPVYMTLYDNSKEFSEKSRLIESYGKIHMRGGTTIGAPQKSFRLSLLENDDISSKNCKKNLLNLRNDDDWILYSAYSDYEKIRTVFTMNIWHEMAFNNNQWLVPVSNQYKYIELFINNRYHGLYALTYPIDAKQFDIENGESLFKKKDWSQTEFSHDLEPDESGGYWLPGYALQEGDSNGYQQLHNLYYEMAYSEDAEIIRKTCDIDNAIDLWLFYKFTQAVDNVYATNVKNLFTATKISNDGIDGYKLLFCPWDMDQTFGNRFVDGQGSHGITSYFNPVDYDLPVEWSPVYFLMNSGDTEILNQVKERYKQLRNTCWSEEYIKEAIDTYENDIYDSGAFERTMERWPDANYYSPEVKLDDFEDYVVERLKYMDKYIGAL